jgi:hypothetical protein
MDWALAKTREELKVSTCDLNYVGKLKGNPKEWKTLRESTLKRVNNICRYCGGGYSKYLMCFHLDSNSDNTVEDIKDNLDVCCKLCYMVTHVNYSYLDDIIVCWSELDQVEIVRKTVDYVIKNNKVPELKDIDKNVKQSPLSVMELCSILLEGNKKLLKNINNIKIFFTNKLDTAFIQSYISTKNKKVTFIDIDYIDSEERIKEEEIDNKLQLSNQLKNIQKYKYNIKKDKLVKNFFQ